MIDNNSAKLFADITGCFLKELEGACFVPVFSSNGTALTYMTKDDAEIKAPLALDPPEQVRATYMLYGAALNSIISNMAAFMPLDKLDEFKAYFTSIVDMTIANRVQAELAQEQAKVDAMKADEVVDVQANND
jgi:hypothetical protein